MALPPRVRQVLRCQVALRREGEVVRVLRVVARVTSHNVA